MTVSAIGIQNTTEKDKAILQVLQKLRFHLVKQEPDLAVEESPEARKLSGPVPSPMFAGFL